MRMFYAAVVMVVLGLIGAFWLFSGRLHLALFWPAPTQVVTQPLQYSELPTPAPEQTDHFGAAIVPSPSPVPKITFKHPSYYSPPQPVYVAPPNPNPAITPLAVPSYQPYTPPPLENTPRPIQVPDYSVISGAAASPSPGTGRAGLGSPSPSPSPT
jgi:hypothetical protein